MSQTERGRAGTDKQDAGVRALDEQRLERLEQEDGRGDVDARRSGHVLGPDLLDRQPVGGDAGVGDDHVDVLDAVLFLQRPGRGRGVGLALGVDLDHHQPVLVRRLALLDQLLGC